MYFCVSKIVFAMDVHLDQDARQLKALCEKVRKRYRVTCKVIGAPENAECGIAITSLARSRERLVRTIDEIVKFCELSGFGRVDHEISLLDHLDNLEDNEPYE